MQRRDLIVEIFALLVETTHAAGDHVGEDRIRDDRSPAIAGREIGRQLQQSQRTTRVAVGRLRQPV